MSLFLTKLSQNELNCFLGMFAINLPNVYRFVSGMQEATLAGEILAKAVIILLVILFPLVLSTLVVVVCRLLANFFDAALDYIVDIILLVENKLKS